MNTEFTEKELESQDDQYGVNLKIPDKNLVRLSIVASLAALVFICGLISTGFNSYRKNLAEIFLTQALQKTDTETISAGIEEYNRDPKLMSMFSRIIGSSYGSARISSRTLNQLLGVLNSLSTDNHSKTVKLLLDFNKEHYGDLAVNMKANKRAEEVLAKLKKSQKRFFDLATQIRSSSSDANVERLKYLKGLLENLQDSDYNYLMEFATLLSLQHTIGRVDKSSIDFYESGLLSGLPVIPEIPDNIKSAKELKNHLDFVGGRVNLKGKNAATLFQEKLKEIREGVSEKRQLLEKTNQEMDDLSTGMKVSTKDLEKERLVLKGLLVKSLLLSK